MYKKVLTILVLLLASGAYAQSLPDIAYQDYGYTTPVKKVTQMYYSIDYANDGSVKNVENVEEAVFMAEEYEALMARQGFTFLRTDTVSKSDYKLHWTKKYDGSVMQARIHYQFLIPYFKITIEDIRVTFSNGEVLNITSHLQNEMVRKQFNSLYEMLVQTLVRLIDPAKTLTKEQLRNALENIDKMPDIIKND